MVDSVLSDGEVAAFMRDGFVKVVDAFPETLAAEGRDILWREMGLDPDRPATWTRPVVRIDERSDRPFAEAANTPRLHGALNQIVGEDRWLPRRSLGSFPIRFPSRDSPGDDGWHVEASFPGDDPTNYMSYRVNLVSQGRALLMLFLFSDVGADDAPTRVRVGSHRPVARILADEGLGGLSFMDLADRLDATEGCRQSSAVGPAGTVYLCHPFLVHAAQPHHGRRPRFMAQPPLYGTEPLRLNRSDPSPVERAITEAIGGEVPGWAASPDVSRSSPAAVT